MTGHDTHMKRIPVLIVLLAGLFAGASCQQAVPQTSSSYEHLKAEGIRNFYRFSPDLYRSRQPDKDGFKAAEKLGIKSVLNLREYHTDNKEARHTGLNLYRYRLAAGEITRDQLLDNMVIITNAAKPILIHCKHGSDRTGAICATYRIVEQGWTVDDAVKEMKDGPFGFHASYYSNIPKLLKSIDWVQFKADLKAKTTPAKVSSKP